MNRPSFVWKLYIAAFYLFLFAPHINIDATDDELKSLAQKASSRNLVIGSVVAPVWPSFRAQVVHTDLTSDNALVDERGRITGIVDFGDASHSALIVDLAGVLDSLLADRHGDELFRATRLILDGYERHVALEPLERRLLGELLATRAAVTITISSWRVSRLNIVSAIRDIPDVTAAKAGKRWPGSILYDSTFSGCVATRR